MNRWLVVPGALMWVGLTLILAERRWFRRPSLTDRIRPYTPGGLSTVRRSGVLSVGSFRDVIGPLAASVGNRVSRSFGVADSIETRLERARSPLTVQGFRMRQIGSSVVAFAVASVASLILTVPGPIALIFIAGSPLLAFLALEQSLDHASKQRQRRIFLELPVLSEQLGMLLSSGFSLGASLQRIAIRGTGACADDLKKVCGRMRQGLSEIDALREWSKLTDVEALDRLVAVLALNSEAGDLGTLISEEARAIRRDAQRELMATIDKRSQQVWIPVTVATLVPGVIFLSVPFVAAIQLFTNN